jgi:hypothetical protein
MVELLKDFPDIAKVLKNIKDDPTILSRVELRITKGVTRTRNNPSVTVQHNGELQNEDNDPQTLEELLDDPLVETDHNLHEHDPLAIVKLLDDSLVVRKLWDPIQQLVTVQNNVVPSYVRRVLFEIHDPFAIMKLLDDSLVVRKLWDPIQQLVTVQNDSVPSYVRQVLFELYVQGLQTSCQLQEDFDGLLLLF